MLVTVPVSVTGVRGRHGRADDASVIETSATARPRRRVGPRDVEQQTGDEHEAACAALQVARPHPFILSCPVYVGLPATGGRSHQYSVPCANSRLDRGPDRGGRRMPADRPVADRLGALLAGGHELYFMAAAAPPDELLGRLGTTSDFTNLGPAGRRSRGARQFSRPLDDRQGGRDDRARSPRPAPPG